MPRFLLMAQIGLGLGSAAFQALAENWSAMVYALCWAVTTLLALIQQKELENYSRFR